MPALVHIGQEFRLRSPEPSDLDFIGSDVSSGGSGGSGGSDIQILSGGGDDDKCK